MRFFRTIARAIVPDKLACVNLVAIYVFLTAATILVLMITTGIVSGKLCSGKDDETDSLICSNYNELNGYIDENGQLNTANSLNVTDADLGPLKHIAHQSFNTMMGSGAPLALILNAILSVAFLAISVFCKCTKFRAEERKKLLGRAQEDRHQYAVPI